MKTPQKAPVTVIVPIYNVEEYIAKCLTSLSSQTFTNFLVLAISDGSPDDSAKIARKIASQDKRILVLEKENGGYGSAINYALQHTNSDFFIICDPDDWLPDNAIETLYNTAKKHNADIVVGSRYNIYTTNDQTEYRDVNNGIFKVAPNAPVDKKELIDKYSFLDISPHAKLYRREIVENLQLPKKVSYTDFMLYLSALANCKRIIYIEEPLAYYLQDRPGNTATNKTLKSVADHITVMTETLLYLQNAKEQHPILHYRIFSEYKMVLELYSRNCNLIHERDVYKSMIKIRHMLQEHTKEFRTVTKELSFKKQLDIIVLLMLPINLSLYISINKIFRPKWRKTS